VTPYRITLRLVGATGAVTAFCDTLMNNPAMLINAERDVIPVFAGTV